MLFYNTYEALFIGLLSRTRKPLQFAPFGFCSCDIWTVSERQKQKTANELKRDAKRVAVLQSVLEVASDKRELAHLGGVGSNVAKQASKIDRRHSGLSKLAELAAAIRVFDVDERVQNDGHLRSIDINDTCRKPRK